MEEKRANRSEGGQHRPFHPPRHFSLQTDTARGLLCAASCAILCCWHGLSQRVQNIPYIVTLLCLHWTLKSWMQSSCPNFKWLRGLNHSVGGDGGWTPPGWWVTEIRLCAPDGRFPLCKIRNASGLCDRHYSCFVAWQKWYKRSLCTVWNVGTIDTQPAWEQQKGKE